MELAINVGAPNTPTTTTLAASPSPAKTTDSITLTATVTSPSGTPGGTVEFFEGSTSLGTSTVNNGTATLVLTGVAVGTHTYHVVFTPTAGSSSPTLSILPAYHPIWTQVGNANASSNGNDTRYILPDGDNQHVWVTKGYTNATESARLKRIDLTTGTASAEIVLPLQIGNLSYTSIAPQVIVGDPDGQHVYVFEEFYISSRRVNKLHKYQYNEVTGEATEVGLLDGTGVNDHRLPCPTDWNYFSYNGKFYLSLMFDSDGGSYDNATNFTAGAVIINLTDMVVVGYFPTDKAHFTKLAAGDSYWYCRSRSTFVDKNGDVWFVFFYNASSLGSTYWMYFFRWHPADGTSGTITWGNIASGPVLNCGAGLTKSLSGLFTGDTNTWLKMVGYEPSTHSALVGTYKNATGPVVRLSLADLSLQAQHQDDGTFYYLDSVYTPAERCFFNGVHDGKIIFEGDTRGTIPTQYGGIFNIVDPVTLTVSQTINVSTMLQSSGLVQPPLEWVSTKFVYPPISNFITYDNKKIAFIYGPSGGSNPGSELYLLDMEPATYDGSTSANVDELVTNPKLPTTTMVTSTPNPQMEHSAVTLTATVTGDNAPTGSVEFVDQTGSVTLGTATLVNGTATLNTSALAAGDRTIAANYLGDNNNYTSSATTTQTIIPQALTTTTLTAPAYAYTGQEVVLTAKVTGNHPTGTVTFSSDVDGELGTATLTDRYTAVLTVMFSIATHVLTATYNGDIDNLTSAATATLPVIDGTPTIYTLRGFALVAEYKDTGDTSLPATVNFNIYPETVSPNSVVYALWDSTNVSAVRITSEAGFDTGLINTSGSGVYAITVGFTETTTLTMTGYDSAGDVLVTSTCDVVVSDEAI